MPHAVVVVVAAKADDNQAFLFGEDGLVDVPACLEMGNYDGAHSWGARMGCAADISVVAVPACCAEGDPVVVVIEKREESGKMPLPAGGAEHLNTAPQAANPQEDAYKGGQWRQYSNVAGTH